MAFIDAFIAGYWHPSTTTFLHRVLPIALLAIPAGFAARFIVRLPPTMRRYLLQLMSRDRTRNAVALEVVAVAAIIASCLTTHSAHVAMISLAVLTAFAGRLVLISAHWSSIALRRKWSLRSTVFALIAIAPASAQVGSCEPMCSHREAASNTSISSVTAPRTPSLTAAASSVCPTTTPDC